MKQALLFFSFSVIITSCTRKKMIERVDRYNIRTIAILPVQLEITGNMPKNVTTEQFQKTVEEHRKFMYQSLYIDLVQFYDYRTRNYSQVQFQSIDKTLTLMNEKGMTDSTAWQMDPQELARILNVDAVVTMKVTQNRIMRDEVALGVDVIGGIVNQTIPRLNLPTGAARTSDIYVNCALVKGSYTMWSTRFRNQTDWNYPVQQAIQSVTRGIANNFPL